MAPSSKPRSTGRSSEIPGAERSIQAAGNDDFLEQFGIKNLADVDVADCEYNDERVEVEGVVSPNSQGGWLGTDKYEVHCFSFAAWRKPGQPVAKRKLTILRPVTPDADYSDDFPEFTIHRIKVLLSTDETRAVFAGVSEFNAEVTELAAVAEELKKPVIISTSQFGDLTLDRSVNWFEGTVEWNGETIQIHFETHDDRDISRGLSVAEQLWAAQAEWKRKVDDFAVQELLPLKNGRWLEEGEKPLTAEQFKRRMTLGSITIHPDGEFEFWHDDGDLFWGHSIQVSGSLKDGLTEADIPG